MPMKAKPEDHRYPSYFDAVINEAVTDGLTEEDIVKNGYRIYRSGSGARKTKLRLPA